MRTQYFTIFELLLNRTPDKWNIMAIRTSTVHIKLRDSQILNMIHIEQPGLKRGLFGIKIQT